MKKYTNLELSRILSCAAGEQLGAPAGSIYGEGETVCIEQAASGITSTATAVIMRNLGGKTDGTRMRAFDSMSWNDPKWKDPDQTLGWIREKGMI